MAMISLIIFYFLGKRVASKDGGHLLVFFLLSGYLVWYATSSFNEATSFTLMALLAFSILFQWNKFLIGVIGFLCCLTKEVMFPYAIFMAFIAFTVCSKDQLNIINRSKYFIREYYFLIIAIFIAVGINVLFNYFRYGTYQNIALLNPAFLNPWKYVPIFFYNLFFSPAAGLLFVWFSALIFIFYSTLNSIIFIKRDYILLISIFGFFLVNIGLARWFSPFGAVAWGPRLTLPFLGALLVILLYKNYAGLLNRLNILRSRSSALFYTLILIVSSLPNIAFLVDNGIFHRNSAANIPKVVLESGIKNFNLETAGTPLYQKAIVEGLNFDIIIISTIEVFKNNYFTIIFWALSFILGIFIIIYNKYFRVKYLYPKLIFIQLVLLIFIALATYQSPTLCSNCYKLWQKLSFFSSSTSW